MTPTVIHALRRELLSDTYRPRRKARFFVRWEYQYMRTTSACDRDTIVDEDSEILQRYVQDKLAIAHQVRLLEHLLRTRESTERAAQCHALTTKLAEDRFTLAVVGQFKRGKSS